jgi:hypothetical protein
MTFDLGPKKTLLSFRFIALRRWAEGLHPSAAGAEETP